MRKTEFLLRFTILFLLTYPPVILFEIRPYEDLVALIVSVFLSILGIAHSVFGNVITTGTGSFQVDPSCTGFVSLSLLFSMIFSPGLICPKKQARAFLIGSGFLLSWNTLRVLILVVSGLWMDFFHLSLWMISGAFIIWFWYRKIVVECGVSLD